MKRENNLLGALVLALSLGGVLVFAGVGGGPQSQRGECQKACTDAYQSCRSAANANQSACKTAFDECRKNCKDVAPHASPSPTVSPLPSPSPSPSPSASPSPSPGL